MKLSKIGTLYRTLKHLKFIQFYYRLKYALRSKLGRKVTYSGVMGDSNRLAFACRAGCPVLVNYLPTTFTFLNISHSFNSIKEINWNEGAYGKLWTYNLNYFEFLHLQELDNDSKLELVFNFIDQYGELKDGLEPYPTSLRIINWIRFLSEHGIKESKVDAVLMNDLHRLSHTLEFHLLGNHLLENGFSLLMGGVYFNNTAYTNKAVSILSKQLEEQILQDGMHFERSVMYHCIVLNRVLEAYDLLNSNNHVVKSEFIGYLKGVASKMLGFLKALHCEGDRIPLFNDAAQGITFTPSEFFRRASELSIIPLDLNLSDSGFRVYVDGPIKLYINVGGVAPSYQPGHAHADTFTYELHYDEEPVIVETGTSTYQTDNRRSVERATSSHNTVCINDLNSSEVWGGFRVGRRASVEVMTETADGVCAKHKGYQYIGITHKRSLTIDRRNHSINVSDSLIGLKSEDKAISNIHFYPGVKLDIKGDTLEINNGTLTIDFINFHSLQLESCEHALGFNKLVSAQRISGQVGKESKLNIRYEN